MIDLLEREAIQSYVIVVAYIVVGSHVLIYLLSIVGILLRPFSRFLWIPFGRQPSSLLASAAVWCVRLPIVLLYPWMHLWTPTPNNMDRTPLGSLSIALMYILLIHTLWLTSSIGIMVSHQLIQAVIGFAVLFPDLASIHIRGDEFWGWPPFLVESSYVGFFTIWSSWMWYGSLRRALAHFRREKSAGYSGDRGDAGLYLMPFRKATWWAFATLPNFFVILVFQLLTHPAPFG